MASTCSSQMLQVTLPDKSVLLLIFTLTILLLLYFSMKYCKKPRTIGSLSWEHKLYSCTKRETESESTTTDGNSRNDTNGLFTFAKKIMDKFVIKRPRGCCSPKNTSSTKTGMRQSTIESLQVILIWLTFVNKKKKSEQTRSSKNLFGCLWT